MSRSRNEPSAASNSSIASVASNLRRSGAAGDRLAVFGAVPGIKTGQTAIKLARALAEHSRVVLVGLASGDATIRGISSEPSAAGLAELASGAASFGAIITKDKLSPLHLISSGHSPIDRNEILSSPGMAMKFDALARSYDHVVVDAGEAAGPGDRADRRDCAARRAGHRHAEQCRHGLDATAPAELRALPT